MSDDSGADGVMEISGKFYYSISEVCALIGVEPHVLRYWESEFPRLRPKKNRAGNRAYRDKDIEIIKTIKKLLYEEGFTIPGARRKLAGERAATPDREKKRAAASNACRDGNMSGIANELKEILSMLG